MSTEYVVRRVDTTTDTAAAGTYTADTATLGRLLYDFNTEFGAPTPDAEEFAGRLRDQLPSYGMDAFLAEDDQGTATGFALVSSRPTPYFDGPLVQLEELYVLPRLRDQGIGTVMLDAVVEFARSEGSEEIHIGVDEIDTDTRRFYERHGFVNIQPGEDFRMLMYLREL